MEKHLSAQTDNLIQNLTLEELININRKIVERIKFLQTARNLTEMQKFHIGDQVGFHNGAEVIKGKIFKFNQKTVSIMTDRHVQWNVSPRFLKKL